jgi:hypothetical protein
MLNRKTVLLALLLTACLAVIGLSMLGERSGFFHAWLPFGAEAQEARLAFFDGVQETGPFGLHPAGWQGSAGAVATFVFLLLFGTILLFVFPRRIAALQSQIRPGFGNLFRLFGIGLLTELSLAAVVFLGFFSVVASPFSILLILGLILIGALGWVSVAYAFGRWMLRRLGFESRTPLGEYAAGLVVLYAAGRIPILGWLVLVVVIWLGVGAALVSRFGTAEPWSLRELMD